MQQVSFTYRNHKGVTRERTVIPDSVEFIREPGFDYQPGWFLSGIDVEKGERRSFALSHISVTDAKILKLALKA